MVVGFGPKPRNYKSAVGILRHVEAKFKHPDNNSTIHKQNSVYIKRDEHNRLHELLWSRKDHHQDGKMKNMYSNVSHDAHESETADGTEKYYKSKNGGLSIPDRADG